MRRRAACSVFLSQVESYGKQIYSCMVGLEVLFNTEYLLCYSVWNISHVWTTQKILESKLQVQKVCDVVKDSGDLFLSLI